MHALEDGEQVQALGDSDLEDGAQVQALEDGDQVQELDYYNHLDQGSEVLEVNASWGRALESRDVPFA